MALDSRADFKAKRKGRRKTAAHKMWRFETSRGEQLLRRNWEVTAICISCARYA